MTIAVSLTARAAAAATNADQPIRVMIIDDSIVARTVMARIVDSQDDMVVVAQAGNGMAALARLAEQPVDAILLDLEMPGQGGLEALPNLIEASGGARVLVVSSACSSGAAASVEALRLGAADTLLKPSAGELGDAFARALTQRLRRTTEAPTREVRAPLVPMRATSPVAKASPVECLAIGASTGGVHALAAFFAAFPRDTGLPILITQHLPAPFMVHFARQIGELASRRALVAVDGMALDPDTILLAPGDAHLGLARTRGTIHVRLDRTPAPSGCRPSVDPMLASVAKLYGKRGLGIIFSGMGRDGLDGARAVTEAGGTIAVQDAGSSVVWGMPGAVAGAGLASTVLPPAALADWAGSRIRGSGAWK